MRVSTIAVVLVSMLWPASSVFGSPFFMSLGEPPNGDNVRASDISADGSVVVGNFGNSDGGDEAFRWTEGEGIVGLGRLPGGGLSEALGVSSDAGTIVGASHSQDGIQAYRWTNSEGMVGLGIPTGWEQSCGRDTSADGSVIVGNFSNYSPPHASEAFRWTAGTGMVGLGDLPGGIFRSTALATSTDGTAIVGWANSESGEEAFRWTAADGMVGLGDFSGGSYMDSS